MSWTKEALMGLEVYDHEGHLVGTVKDVGFTVGQDSISLIVCKDKGEGKPFAWRQVQAVGDIVLLKKPEQAQAQKCPSCGEPLTYIEQYKRWYCYKEKKYA